MFVDTCTAHPADISHLQNVGVEFFPANCTRKLQPLDLGIIHNLKLNYRQMLVQLAINCVDQWRSVGI